MKNTVRYIHINEDVSYFEVSSYPLFENRPYSIQFNNKEKRTIQNKRKKSYSRSYV